MSQHTYYFDNAATTKISKEVINSMQPYLNEIYGNASSIYSIGRETKKQLSCKRKSS